MSPEDHAELERWRDIAAATPGRTARTLLDACNAIEALDQENARLTYQRDQAREATDRNDTFVNELCTLIPDDRDDDVAAEAIIIDWVKETLADRDRFRDLVNRAQSLREHGERALTGPTWRQWDRNAEDALRADIEGGE